MLTSKVRASSNVDTRSIRQHLHQIASGFRGANSNTVVGLADYYPGGASGESRGDDQSGKGLWEELEMQAAGGVQGSLHENFVESVQVMDQTTDNSQMPFTVVKGEEMRDMRWVCQCS